MSKGLEDDLHRRFVMMCAYEGMTLKDQLYKVIKEEVEGFEEYLKEERGRSS